MKEVEGERYGGTGRVVPDLISIRRQRDEETRVSVARLVIFHEIPVVPSLAPPLFMRVVSLLIDPW